MLAELFSQYRIYLIAIVFIGLIVWKFWPMISSAAAKFRASPAVPLPTTQTVYVVDVDRDDLMAVDRLNKRFVRRKSADGQAAMRQVLQCFLDDNTVE